MAATSRDFHPLGVTHLGFWARPHDEREQVFRQLRDEAPVSWHPPMQGGMLPSNRDGMWVATRHEHVTEVSLHPERFCSGQGVQFADVPVHLLEATQSFLAMDAPRHQQLRRLVSSAFTPRQVARLDDQIQQQAHSIVDGLIDAGAGDFVELVSRRLPMWTVYEMVGLDPALREEAAELADVMVSFDDEEVVAGRDVSQLANATVMQLLTIGLECAEQRRKKPADDLMTNLVQAEIDGVGLTDNEIAAFFVLLSVAGNDTTRNTISLTTHALQQHPDQRAWLVDDFEENIGPATEEFLRWATPVMTFRRTATEDTELGGQHIAKGEWVAMIYSSANRDERVFEEPYRLDLSRKPNRHVGFGGGGPHFCMGSFVAKMQIKHLFRELLTRTPNLEVAEPIPLVGSFVRSVKSVPCSLR